ncbi:MAG: hypothetical protein CMJ83_21110 [Planctomycetes bacterium]|nr:hypothetical protein [Planctomycetota bacterium]
MRFRLILPVLAVILSSLPAQYEGAKPVPQGLKKGFASISPDYCEEILSYLAGPECQGRGTGTDGYQKAADFVAARFKEFGLKPIGEKGTYFQHVPFTVARTDPKSHLKFRNLKLRCGEHVAFRAADVETEAEVVFVTGGFQFLLETPTKLNRRIVILHGDVTRRSSGVRRQMRRNRPAAILAVADSVQKPVWTPSSRRRRRTTQVNGSITLAAAKRLAKAIGVGERALTVAEGEEDGNVTTPASGRNVALVVKKETKSRGVPNVVGLLEGSDPKLKKQTVIAGSHLDHLGVGTNGVVYPGADDDGSGSAALVALARALSKNPRKPKRSVLFLAFCGEERGLVGSRYYTDHPIIPLEDAICELQMDMVGRNEEHHPSENRTNEKGEDNVKTTHLIGSKRISQELHETVLAMNEHIGFTLEYDQEGVYTRSDHYMFARKGIPISFFFSGFHKDYHRPSDTVDKINFTKIANTAKLVYLTVHAVGNKPHRLKRERKSR